MPNETAAIVVQDRNQPQIRDLLRQRSPDKLQKAQQMAAGLDLRKAQAVLAFGVSDQKKLVEFTDSVLSSVRAGDAGPAGQLMSELKGKILDLRVGSLPRTPAGALSSAI